VVDTLDPDEMEPWQEDLKIIVGTPTVTDDGKNCVYVQIDMHEHWAPVLSGGFDECVLDRLMEVPGVTGCGHSDRIRRT
jgi:hypothetical protein